MYVVMVLAVGLDVALDCMSYELCVSEISFIFMPFTCILHTLV